MKYQIVVEPEALEDLYKIKTYITDQDSVSKANKFISELKDKIKSLSQMPQRCRKSYYTDKSDTYDLIYKRYTIVFQILEDRVHILTIFRQKNYNS
jgi:plasmid stabilization system protein ParE